MINRPRALAFFAVQAHGFVSNQPSKLHSLRRPFGWHYSVNHQGGGTEDGVGGIMGADRRFFLGALAALAVLGPAAGEAAYFADDVGSWKRLPSATEMSRDFVKVV